VKSKVICSVFTAAVLMMVSLCGFSQSNQSIAVPGTEADAKPLLLEKRREAAAWM